MKPLRDCLLNMMLSDMEKKEIKNTLGRKKLFAGNAIWSGVPGESVVPCCFMFDDKTQVMHWGKHHHLPAEYVKYVSRHATRVCQKGQQEELANSIFFEMDDAVHAISS